MDLVPILGIPSRVSEILRARGRSYSHATTLARRRAGEARDGRPRAQALKGEPPRQALVDEIDRTLDGLFAASRFDES